MAHMVMKLSVQDFGKWKPFFEANGERRKAAGCCGALVLHSAENPNQITVITEWDSLENAKRFAETPVPKEAMEKAGVIGQPERHTFGESVRTDS